MSFLILIDQKRICKYICSSIFDENVCCIWDGYVTNINNKSKGTYVNFFFGGRKVALHRLLYTNFVEELHDNEYLKFSCENKGRCCNIHHLKKFKYQGEDYLQSYCHLRKDERNVVGGDIKIEEQKIEVNIITLPPKLTQHVLIFYLLSRSPRMSILAIFSKEFFNSSIFSREEILRIKNKKTRIASGGNKVITERLL